MPQRVLFETTAENARVVEKQSPKISIQNKERMGTKFRKNVHEKNAREQQQFPGQHQPHDSWFSSLSAEVLWWRIQKYNIFALCGEEQVILSLVVRQATARLGPV